MALYKCFTYLQLSMVRVRFRAVRLEFRVWGQYKIAILGHVSAAIQTSYIHIYLGSIVGYHPSLPPGSDALLQRIAPHFHSLLL